MLRAQPSISVPWALTVIGLGAFMTALDQTVVVTVLPSVMLDLKIPATDLDRASWIITAITPATCPVWYPTLLRVPLLCWSYGWNNPVVYCCG